MSRMGGDIAQALGDSSWPPLIAAVNAELDASDQVTPVGVFMVDGRTIAVAYRRGGASRLWVALLDLIEVEDQYEGARDVHHLAQLVVEEIEEPAVAYQVARPPVLLPISTPADTIWRGLTLDEVKHFGAVVLDAVDP